MERSREARFVALYRRYQPQILAYARRRFSESDADEVVADAFLVAWRHLDAAPADPLPWLYRLAGNCGANHRRRSVRWDRLRERAHARMRVDAGPDPAGALGEVDEVAAALAQLPARDQEVLRLAAWEGLDGPGLAVALGCSPAAARVRLHRARRRLRRLLSAHEEPFPSSAPHAPEVLP